MPRNRPVQGHCHDSASLGIRSQNDYSLYRARPAQSGLAGNTVRIWRATITPAARLRVNLRSLPREPDAVITMLPGSEDVAEAVDTVAHAIPAGSLLIEMSSGVPAVTRKTASRLAAVGVATVDCPVSCGVARARTGKLTNMAGGSQADLDRADPVLAPLGRRRTKVARVASLTNRCRQSASGT